MTIASRYRTLVPIKCPENQLILKCEPELIMRSIFVGKNNQIKIKYGGKDG
jgi:hypothetical protein